MPAATLKEMNEKLDKIIRLLAINQPDWPKAIDEDITQFEELNEIAIKLHGAGKVSEAKALLTNKYGYGTLDSATEQHYPAIKRDLLKILEG